MRPLLRQLTALRPGAGATAAFACAALIVAIGVWHVSRAWDAALEGARGDVRNLSRSLAEHADGLLDGIDLTLGGMAERAVSDDRAALAGHLRRRAGGLPHVRFLAVLDAEGRWLAHSREADAVGRVPAPNRDDLRWHRDRPDPGLRVGVPTHDRGHAGSVIAVSRRFNRPDGSFGGIVTAALDPGVFQSVYDGVLLDPQSVIALWHEEGRLLVRRPAAPEATERDFTGSAFFRALQAEPGPRVFETPGAVDGVRRLTGFARLDHHPSLAVSVGMSLEGLVARWRREALIEAVALGLSALALIGLGIGLERRERRLRAAEAATRDANRLLVMAEQMAQVGHWHLDVAGGRLRWSDEVFRIHGHEPGSFQPRLEDGVAAFHPDDRASVAAMIAEAIERRKSFEFTLRLVRPDGEIRHVQSRGICELGPARDGTEPPVTGLFGVFSDITGRVRAEASFVSSEARYRMLADATTDMVAQLGPDGCCLYVSPAVRDLLGREPEAVTGTMARDLIHPDEAADLDRVLGEIAAGQRDRDVLVHRLRHRDGPWIWVEASLKVLRLPGGRLGGFVASVRNIDERRRADEARRESEARYRLLADNASDLIVLGHADGRRSYISPAVTAMLGYTVEEAYRIPMRAWIHPEDIAEVFGTTLALSDARPTAKVVYRLRHKAGYYIWAEAAFRRVAGEGEDVQIVTAIRDVSERQRQARHLEHAKTQAEAGARVKAEFLANMSHELRTPLAGMLGTHDLLQSDPSLTQAQRRLVGLAQESGRSLLTIVNDVLDFSKIEAGELAIESVPFSLASVVEGCRRLAAEAARDKGVAVTVSIDPDLPDLFRGDPTRLRQILLNLATNAVKFTGAGTVAITAARLPDRDGTPQVRISVSDTGIGIPAEALPRLFERFSQADGSMARRFGGTGLGLAICKRLAGLMDGDIGVESRVGEGSTFWFALPLPLAQDDRHRGDRPAVERPEWLGAAVSVRRILLAEDNRINCEIVTTVLERKGHAVTTVGDGRAALEAARTGTDFDVILMDVQMPEMDGLDATAAIRALEREQGRARMPVIALTANAMAEEIERCRAAGTDAHVAKPVNWPELFATIDRVCARPSPERSAARVLDETALEMMAGVVGRDRITDLLACAMREIERRVALVSEPDVGAAAFATEAHALVSLAGQLGFVELSDLCRELERQPSDTDGRLRSEALRGAAARARSAIDICAYAQAA